MRLTVAIPTFDRNEVLKESIQRLLPQLTSDCELVVLDNCSKVPVFETLEDILSKFPRLDVTIIRNRANVSGVANVARCFEVCKTEWLWILSDDDWVACNAVEIIWKNITAQPETLFFNYTSPMGCRNETVSTRGSEDLIKKADSYANLMFISTGVYRADRLLANLKYGYIYAYSGTPHLAILFTTLGEFGECVLSAEQILDSVGHAAANQKWPQLDFALSLTAMLDLPMKPKARTELARKIA